MSGPLKEITPSMFDFLMAIKSRPGLYLDDDKSIKRLRSFLVGFSHGLATGGLSLKGENLLLLFNEWVAKRLGYAHSSKGWCSMILESSASDEEAFDRFFLFSRNFGVSATINEKGIAVRHQIALLMSRSAEN